MADERWKERFQMAENASRERSAAIERRIEMAENASRERSEMAENASHERFEAMDRRWTERFESYEKKNEAAHAAICSSVAKLGVRLEKLDERTRADAAALREHFDERFDAVNARFDTMNARTGERFDAVNARFDTMNARFDERFDAMNTRFDDLYRHVADPGESAGQPGPGEHAGE